MGNRDRSDDQNDKKSTSKEHNRSRKRRSRERSIEIISEEKRTDLRNDDLIMDDDDDVLTKRLNASIAKAKERKMKLLETPLVVKSPCKRADESVILLFNTDEIPLPIAKHAPSNLDTIQLPDVTSQKITEEFSLLNSEKIAGIVNEIQSSNPPQPPHPLLIEATPDIPNSPLPSLSPPHFTQDLPNRNHHHQPSLTNIPPTNQPNNNQPSQKTESMKQEQQGIRLTQPNITIEQLLSQSKLESMRSEDEAVKFGYSPMETEAPFKFGQSPPGGQFKFGQSPERNAQFFLKKIEEPFKFDSNDYNQLQSLGPQLPQSYLPQLPQLHLPQLHLPQPQASPPEELSKIKKPMMMMSLKISQTSAALISSGVMANKPVQEDEVASEQDDKKSNSDKKKIKQKKSRWAEEEEEDRDDKKKIQVENKESSWRKRGRSRSGSNRNRSRSPKKSERSPMKSERAHDMKQERSKSPRNSKSSKDHSRRSRSRNRSRRSRSRSRRSRSRRSRSRRSRSRSRRNRSRRSESREKRRSPSWEGKGSRRTRIRARKRKESKNRRRRSSSSSPNKEVDNGLNIDKARLRQIALKNAFKMGLTTVAPASTTNIPSAATSSMAGGSKEGGDLKNNQSIKDLTDFCKKISDVKDEEYDKIVDGGVVVVDEEEMPFIPARTNKDMKSLPSKQQTLQEKLMEMATISSIFPCSRGNDRQDNKPPTGGTTAAEPSTDTKPQQMVTGMAGYPDDEADFKASFISKEALKVNNWVAPGQFISDSTVSSSKPVLQYDVGYRQDKDLFTKAPKMTEGIGMMMLLKLGWKEGQGLGKDNRGEIDPIPVSIKTDRKGLQSSEEDPDVLRMKALEKAMQQQSMLRQMAFMRQAQMMQQRMMMMQGGVRGGHGGGRGVLGGVGLGGGRGIGVLGGVGLGGGCGGVRPPLLPGGACSLRMPAGGLMAAMGNRQPLLPMPRARLSTPLDAASNTTNNNHVSTLTNTCQQQHWPTPEFILLEETHPVTMSKLFKFKIILNEREFISPKPCLQKKQAKSDAALVCLQQLGIPT